jgi:hypothetical protein
VDDLLRFFSMQAMIKDQVMNNVDGRQIMLPNGHVNPKIATAVVTTEVRQFIRMMVRNNERTRVIRDAVKETFGIELSGQYTSILRKRVMNDAD